MRSVHITRATWVALPVASLLLMAASPPPRTYDLRFSREAPVLAVPSSPVIARAPSSGFEVAPTPNRDVFAPAGPVASNDAYLSPGVFARGRQNRGEGFLQGSTAQEDQQRRVMPGAGFNLTMPLQK